MAYLRMMFTKYPFPGNHDCPEWLEGQPPVLQPVTLFVDLASSKHECGKPVEKPLGGSLNRNWLIARTVRKFF
jgi:hypothetical protein